MTALHSGSSTSQLLNTMRTALQPERVSRLCGSAMAQCGTFLWTRSRHDAKNLFEMLLFLSLFPLFRVYRNTLLSKLKPPSKLHS